MKISICTFACILFAVMSHTNSFCTPPGTPTTGDGCSGGNCNGPGSGEVSRLGDGYYGTRDLNVSAVHAWNRIVTVGDIHIMFYFITETTVTGINLYFYNIPSRNTGLPYITKLFHADFFIEGNQDLSQNDNQLRNVTLTPASDLSGTSFTVGFTFSDNDKIDWLLLTEVEICTSDSGSKLTVSDLPPIIFTDDTFNRTYITNSNLPFNLSCSVKNQGRFRWMWILSSGKPQPPTYILDVGRTSVIELSHVTSNEIGDYQCQVFYHGLADAATMFTITLALGAVIKHTDNFTLPVITTEVIQETIMQASVSIIVANTTDQGRATQATSPVTSTAFLGGTMKVMGSVPSTSFPGGTSQVDATLITVVVGGVGGILLVIILVTVPLIIIICVRNRRNLKKNSGRDDTDRNPSAIPTQDQYLAGYDTIQFGENNTISKSTDPGTQHLSMDTLDNDPETGQSISPLYASVQKKKEVSEEDNYGNDGNYPPLFEPLYEDVEKVHKRDGNKVDQNEPNNIPIGFDDKHTKKTQQVEVSNNEQNDEIEYFPEHIYSAVQKKKRKKTREEMIPFDEICPADKESSDSPDCDLKDMYA